MDEKEERRRKVRNLFYKNKTVHQQTNILTSC